MSQNEHRQSHSSPSRQQLTGNQPDHVPVHPGQPSLPVAPAHHSEAMPATETPVPPLTPTPDTPRESPAPSAPEPAPVQPLPDHS